MFTVRISSDPAAYKMRNILFAQFAAAQGGLYGFDPLLQFAHRLRRVPVRPKAEVRREAALALRR
jgi:hypothetical protein